MFFSAVSSNEICCLSHGQQAELSGKVLDLAAIVAVTQRGKLTGSLKESILKKNYIFNSYKHYFMELSNHCVCVVQYNGGANPIVVQSPRKGLSHLRETHPKWQFCPLLDN
jgi:hypothetical protein